MTSTTVKFEDNLGRVHEGRLLGTVESSRIGNTQRRYGAASRTFRVKVDGKVWRVSARNLAKHNPKEDASAMTPEQQERNHKLAEALRSGEFKQGNGRLKYKEDNGEICHCCLGVACEVFIRETGEDRWTHFATDVFGFVTNEEDQVESGLTEVSGLPPAEVQRWFGWSANDPVIEVDGRKDQAAVLNDSGSVDFAAIADGFDRLARWI